jgi:hypothetical protein
MDVETKATTDNVVRVLLTMTVVLLGLILVANGSQVFLNRELPEAWQYVVIAPSDVQLRSEMDRMGSAGWELVSARRASNGETPPTMSYEMIFKKRGVSSTTLSAKP